MTTTSFVRRHVYRLAVGQIFETFDVLSYGARATIDFALKDLVRRGEIVRLSRGIYMRGDESTPLPSLEEIAAFKAKSLGVTISPFEGSSGKHNRDRVFLAHGAESSFQYGEYRIIFKPVVAKKKAIAQSKSSRAAVFKSK